LKFKPIEKYEVYFKEDKGNSFVIVLIPDFFSLEVVESWFDSGRAVVERDYVGCDNVLHKKEPETAGGFYATKIGIFERLVARKRSASIISIRLINEYDVPLGVVLIREFVREAMKKPIFSYSNEDELKKFLFDKYKGHFEHYLKSQVLSERKKQKSLGEFL